VTFPIYNCGKISFRDGMPAISKRCCCWLVPCCSDCYFPVANRQSDIPSLGSNGSQIGGPSTITGFYAQVTDTIEGETEFETQTTFEQNGESVHAIQYNFISTDPDCDYFQLQSRCFWTVPTHYVYESDAGISEGNIGVTVTYTTNGGWVASLEGGGFIFSNPTKLTGCSGLMSWEDETSRYESSPPPGATHIVTLTGSFYANGGKAWPDGFVCNIASNLQGLFNVAENRLAVTTDFPDGWFD
jgi:hypothetical protein